jgi:hypothetical protein
MSIDDPSRNGQTQSGAARPGAKERLKQALPSFRANVAPVIA